MPCPDDNVVAAFIEGELSTSRRGELRAHFEDCDECRQLIALGITAGEARHADDSQRIDDREIGAPAQSASQLKVGSIIQGYRLVRRLGSGAMGVVYAAEQLGLKRQVALKVVRRDHDPVLQVRLLREARAAGAIRHRHVVTVHDVLELADGSPVMVMDLVAGESLRQLLHREGRLPVALALRLIRQIAEGLAAAAAIGIIHRDLKPDNVLLTTEQEVRIVDFGVAKLTALDGPAAETAGLTETGMLLGTPRYMAPEQAFADGDLDARVDLWALGVIGYEALSGTLPIEGNNFGQVLRRLANLSIKPLREVAPEVPPALAQLIDDLLCERAERIRTPTEVIARLDAIAAKPASAPSTISLAPMSEPMAVVRTAMAPERTHGHSRLWFGGACVTLALGGALWLSQTDTPASIEPGASSLLSTASNPHPASPSSPLASVSRPSQRTANGASSAAPSPTAAASARAVAAHKTTPDSGIASGPLAASKIAAKSRKKRRTPRSHKQPPYAGMRGPKPRTPATKHSSAKLKTQPSAAPPEMAGPAKLLTVLPF